MAGLLRDSLLEAAVGLLVVIVAALFIAFAWQQTGGSLDDSIRVKALFPAASGVSVGADVRVAGIKIGSVASERLDPQSYQAELTLALDETVQLPADSSAAITSEGLLGTSYVALLPGGSDQPLRDGDTILDTQGSVDMMGLIGSFVNRSANGAAAPPATMDENAQ
jgi:phospholipid/cholesterol/gamma-HCH transport system substrate-binding protein